MLGMHARLPKCARKFQKGMCARVDGDTLHGDRLSFMSVASTSAQRRAFLKRPNLCPLDVR